MKDVESRTIAMVAKAIIAVTIIAYLAGFAVYYDLRVFVNWVHASSELGLHRIYYARSVFGPSFRVVYPPLAPTLFVASYAVYESIHSTGSSSPAVSALLVYVERLVLKLPLIVSLAALWYLASRRIGYTSSYWLILLGPPLLTIVAVYNFDILMLLFLYGSLEALLASLPFVAGLLAGLAVMSKQIAVLALPALLVIAHKLYGRKGFLGVIAGLALSMSVIAPFIISGFKPLLNSVVGFHEARPPQGPTIWYSLFVLSGYKCSFVVCSLWLILFLPLYLYSLILLLKSRVVDPYIVLAIIFTSYLVVGKVVNPVYLSWSYPFLVVSVARARRDAFRRLLKVFIAGFIVVAAFYALLYFSSAASGLPVYQPEEMRWMSASEIRLQLAASFSAYPLLEKMLFYIISSKPIVAVSTAILRLWPFISIMLSLGYTILMTVTLLNLFKIWRWLGLGDHR